ncbi:unnamed protein product [Phyllotreta striolata]|uniref:Uncharacterized protein n=1 Tax=Phyllotreta striolata TaxID=444603 RepID=A0A9P0DJ45_PHYSR|nr:unnamed protein product [Phyllotreta striolata]
MFIYSYYTMVEFTKVVFLLTFCTGIMSKLSDFESGSESAYVLDSNSAQGFENDVPLHESYRPKHKYKVGTGHQEIEKRFLDANNTIKGMRDPQCAIMYKDNEPVGILQPFEESYKFLPVQGESTYVEINPIPAKRRTVLDILYPNEFTDDYDDDKFSNIAKFADDKYPSVFTKFKITNRLDKNVKEVTKKKSNFKRALLDTIAPDPIQITLKNNEEQNTLVKENAGVEEKLRGILDDMGLIDDYPNQEVKREVEDENLELGTNKINLVKENRLKRENYTENSRMSSESAVTNKKVKRSDNILECTTVEFIGTHNIDDYEKRVEREIRDRIQQLKEEVKKEISNITNNEDETKRKKRQIINTLMDEETNDINPTYNIEDVEKPLIRRKRNTDDGNEVIEEEPDQFERNKLDTNYYDDQRGNEETVNNKINQPKGKYECTCDRNDADCKCNENNMNRRINNKASYPKLLNTKRSKQICSCDKNGQHCKCEDTVKETIPSMAEYYNDYNENNDISAWNDDNQYLTENDYETDYRFDKRAIKPRKFAVNKPLESGEFFVDFRPDAYNLSPLENFRKKREKLGPARLVSYNADGMSPHSRYRRRILKEENNILPRQLIDMSDEDLFGALPQNFDGELIRYKRIRRSNKKR